MTKPKRLIGRDILQKRTLKTEVVEVPDWDGEIILRALSGTQTAEFREYGATIDPATDMGASLKLAAWMIVHCWVDEAGTTVLTLDDMDALLDGNSTDLLNNLGKRAMIISGLAPEAAASAEKNSESRQSADSGIPSLLPLAAAP